MDEIVENDAKCQKRRRERRRGSALKGLLSFTVHNSTYLTFLKNHNYRNSNYRSPEVKEGGAHEGNGCVYRRDTPYSLC